MSLETARNMSFTLPTRMSRCLFYRRGQHPQFLRRESTFTELGVDEELVQRLLFKNILIPTQIQERSIPMVFEGKDVVINAETGSGKTLCYLLPILHRILQKIKHNPLDVALPRPSSIIFTPSLELMYQIQDVVHSLVDKNKIGVAVAHKNSPIILQKHTQILVTQPEYLSKYKLSDFYNVDSIVFDEADLLVTSGYPIVSKIISSFTGNALSLARKRRSRRKYTTKAPDHHVQCLCIGATMPSRNRRSAIPTIKYCLPNIERVESDLVHKGVPSLKRDHILVDGEYKFSKLLDIIDNMLNQDGEAKRILVFMNTLRRAREVYEKMKDKSIPRSISSRTRQLHSEMSTAERVGTMKSFMDGRCCILLTTDIASRGLDFPGVVVIQYDVARNVADILHRAGRTARAGREGSMISFVTDDDKDIYELFEESLNENRDVSHLFSRKQQLKNLIEWRRKLKAAGAQETL